MNKFVFLHVIIKNNRFCFFRGSVIESTLLPITLILEQCQSPMGNVIAPTNFELPISGRVIDAKDAGEGAQERLVIRHIVASDAHVEHVADVRIGKALAGGVRGTPERGDAARRVRQLGSDRPGPEAWRRVARVYPVQVGAAAALALDGRARSGRAAEHCARRAHVRLDELDLLLLIVEALVVHIAHALVAGQEHCAVGGWRTSGAGLQLCIRRVRQFD